MDTTQLQNQPSTSPKKAWQKPEVYFLDSASNDGLINNGGVQGLNESHKPGGTAAGGNTYHS